jgi:hypothetical protein
MIQLRYITQPAKRISYLQLFTEAASLGDCSDIRAAVAYVTRGGVAALRRHLEADWPILLAKARKRWLVGIDWCRSDPDACAELTRLPHSQVRVPFGEELVDRIGCTPLVTFHPKAFLLLGQNTRSVILGSGNLSRSGLTRGHEWGCFASIRSPVHPEEQPVLDSLLEAERWFDHLWRDAVPYETIRRAYERVCSSQERMRNPTPTDDDQDNTGRRGGRGNARQIDPIRLRQLRVAKQLWIEAGNLHHNIRADKPGNQLMLSRMTRVFFGFDARDVPRDTTLGHIAIRYGGNVRLDCSMRFSNNSMDVLTLPLPNEQGPPRYDRRVLAFTRLGEGEYELRLATAADRRAWLRASNELGAAYQMSSGRRWGLL